MRRIIILSRDQRGASAVEFALIAPLFFMLVMGMINGATAFDRKNTMTHAAREGARYGATLYTGGTTGVPNAWFDSVANATKASANGHLASTIPGQYVCVAYIGYESRQGAATDWTRKRVESGGTVTWTTGSVTQPSSWCYNDGRGTNGELRRVQVVTGRQTEFNVVLWSTNINVGADAVARFEAISPR